VRRLLAFWVLGAAVLLSGPPARAEYTVVVIERPFHSQKLAGVVLDPNGAPVEGTRVEERDATFGRVLGFAISDHKGHFSIRSSEPGSNHYLSFLARGFNPLRITVSLRPLAHRELKIRLPIGG
jgi:hypothetical protein